MSYFVAPLSDCHPCIERLWKGWINYTSGPTEYATLAHILRQYCKRVSLWSVKSASKIDVQTSAKKDKNQAENVTNAIPWASFDMKLRVVALIYPCKRYTQVQLCSSFVTISTDYFWVATDQSAFINFIIDKAFNMVLPLLAESLLYIALRLTFWHVIITLSQSLVIYALRSTYNLQAPKLRHD